MFTHIMVGANDVAESKRFYDAALGPLGVPPGTIDPLGRAIYATATGVLMVTKPINGKPASGANGATIGFAAASPEAAAAWHAAGVANGGETCEDAPGVRESAMGNYYLAYLRDPAGNKLCALHRMSAD